MDINTALNNVNNSINNNRNISNAGATVMVIDNDDKNDNHHFY